MNSLRQDFNYSVLSANGLANYILDKKTSRVNLNEYESRKLSETLEDPGLEKMLSARQEILHELILLESSIITILNYAVNPKKEFTVHNLQDLLLLSEQTPEGEES